MGLGQFLADLHKFGSYQAQAASFEPGNYFSNQAALNTIWFD
jgi:hypothetical protein